MFIYFPETMRKYPIVGQLTKVCTESYTYTPTNPEYKNISVTVEPGQSIIIPYGHIQNDKKYFDNPDGYVPERFLDKDKIAKLTFMPFGEGPRACLGKSTKVVTPKFTE